jgi:N-glycosylase/DNA lyase
MKSLTTKIRKLQDGPIGKIVRKRLGQFASFKNKPTEDWFSELCFCILTANSRGRTAFRIQQELGTKGFCLCSTDEIRACIVRNKHRFHNTKTNYIVSARIHTNLKPIVQEKASSQGQKAAREWLVKNVKGLGYKEASHLLRNVGYNDVAIIDRHVLNLLSEHKIAKRPKNLSPKSYLQIEALLADLAQKLKMSLGELDLYLWYMKTGEVLK